MQWTIGRRLSVLAASAAFAGVVAAAAGALARRAMPDTTGWFTPYGWLAIAGVVVGLLVLWPVRHEDTGLAVGFLLLVGSVPATLGAFAASSVVTGIDHWVRTPVAVTVTITDCRFTREGSVDAGDGAVMQDYYTCRYAWHVGGRDLTAQYEDTTDYKDGHQEERWANPDTGALSKHDLPRLAFGAFWVVLGGWGAGFCLWRLVGMLHDEGFFPRLPPWLSRRFPRRAARATRAPAPEDTRAPAPEDTRAPAPEDAPPRP